MNGDGLAIRTNRLVESYGQRRALDGLDLDVRRGVAYGFLEPDGAGTTTAMLVVAAVFAGRSDVP